MIVFTRICNKEAESLPTDISMFTVPWASPASLRYLLAADLKKENKHLDPNRTKEILVYLQ